MKSCTQGVITCCAEEWKVTKEPECGVLALTEGRRETMEAEPCEERRGLEIDERRRGEMGAGEPG